MVRVIVKEGATVFVPDSGGVSVAGPAEVVSHSFRWTAGAETGLETSGEWQVSSEAVGETLPMVREFYWCSWVLVPFALLMGFRSIMGAIKR